MSSINTEFTFEYSQPSEYQFSHDSVFLSQVVFRYLKNNNITVNQGLDLCSGSGVVGLDLLFHLNRACLQLPTNFDFLEVQEQYREHFQLNKNKLFEITHCRTELKYISKNYEVLRSSDCTEKYDLVVCNPPYFFVGQGKMSPSEFKNRCRFFIDSNFIFLIEAIINSLKKNGLCFLLLREQSAHGWSLWQQLLQLLPENITACKLEPIRGTDLVLLQKK